MARPIVRISLPGVRRILPCSVITSNSSFVVDLRDADDGAVLVGDLDVLHAEAAAAGDAILVELGLLRVALFGDREQRAARLGHLHRDHLVVLAQLDAAHAVGRAAHRADVVLREADRLAVACVPMKISLWPSDSCTAITASPSSMPIAMMPPARGLLKADSSVFLIVPLRVPITTKSGFVELAHRQHRRDLLAGFHLHEVGDRLAPAVGADVRDLVDLQPVGAAAVR